ncbi:conserved hypothetical protein [Vibrio crassostreae]|uniref:hypothetical protein n=1 Tax=Vibrio crassostreae TaxID=246167 RepID=UPI000F49486B|nr:hypothetical protein [Vibrio crassostreae]ROR19900.1 hypothetical protein EDB36_1011058 [Vibrio crassostreae]CAK2159080.1 conserved hypothetical protein [Vibrio crassostreae]CAK2361477.1 conserved hypothetical protein [Vibrio crassostreae]CAK2375656.1 conserved hypothetical protein [Vibrio crassostreae]CAK3479260.1 conserved hypothetical protein [Vibrio crassostreae]
MSSETYEVAHIREQGQDMIIIPVDARVNNFPPNKQNELRNSLQIYASDAGLAGEVCVVWQVGRNFHFMAPNPWHAFFKSIDMRFVARNINKKLMCRS